MANRAYAHLYKSKLWRELRIVHLTRNPLCKRCEDGGRMEPGVEVHHVVAHRGNKALFNDLHNLESLCKSCHSRIEQSIERRGFDKGVGADGWPEDERHPVNGGSGARPFGFSIPWEARPARIPVNLICGAPGAGKTTYALEQMREGDVLIDLDEILQELGFPRWTDDPVQLLRGLRERDRRIEALADRMTGSAWVVTQAPTVEERHEWERALVGDPFNVRVIEASRRTCRARVRKREQGTDRILHAVDAWFARFTC